MKKLTLNEFAQIAEVVAAVAIIMSLVYVGFEVRENTNRVEAASLESGVGFIRAINGLMATDESAVLVLKGLSDFNGLTPVEKARFDSLVANVTTHFTIARRLYLDGYLADDEYRGYEEMLARILLSPGANEWHSITKHTYPDYLETLFDNIIERNSELEPLSEYYKFERGGR
jgi:hypothetical protein